MQWGSGAVWVILACISVASTGFIAGCSAQSTKATTTAADTHVKEKRAVVTLTRSAYSRSTAKAKVTAAALPADARPSVQYLTRLSDAVERARTQMPLITTSAELAASRVTRGAHLYVGGSQPEFLNEMIDRAGGLALVAPVPKIVNRGDTILYAVPSRLTVADRGRIAKWRTDGAYVIGFASASLSSDPYFQPDLIIDSGGEEGLQLGDGTICPTDTVANLINAWTWTGEFVAACSRLDRTPVLNQSLGEEGAVYRAKIYRGRTFHDDMTMNRIAPGKLGGAYLDCLAASLAGMLRKSPATLEFGGRWLRDAPVSSRGLYVASPIYPTHFDDPRAPRLFGRSSELQLRQPPQTPVSVVIGYEDPPQIAIDFATMRRGRLIYTSARRDGADNRQEVLYVDPHTPRGDACVSVTGYDINILPSSSVMQAAVYWALVAETTGARSVEAVSLRR